MGQPDLDPQAPEVVAARKQLGVDVVSWARKPAVGA